MVRAGLDLPDELLALAAASHSGGSATATAPGASWNCTGSPPADLENSTDLPYGTREREKWLRDGGQPTQLAQNCSGKHAAMAATCVINGWPVHGYLDPAHPLQQLVARTVADLTGEDPGAPARRLRHPAVRPHAPRHGPRLRPARRGRRRGHAPEARKPPSDAPCASTPRWSPARTGTSPR